jgi:hypothetical protein
VNPEDQIVKARYELKHLPAALASLAEDVYSPSWTQESGRASRDHRRIPWAGAEPVQAAYLQIVGHIADAHWALERGTDVDELWLVPWAQDKSWKPLDLRIPTVPVGQALLMAAMLDRALGTLQAVWEVLGPPERSAAVEAAGHVSGAYACVPDGFGDKQANQPERRECASCDKEARPGGKECQACARKRQRRAA